MTNAEKYEEVFGLEVDKNSCPTFHCSKCPLKDASPGCETKYADWWDSEYKGKMTLEERLTRLEQTVATLLRGVSVMRKSYDGIGLTEDEVEFLKGVLGQLKTKGTDNV